MRHIHGWPARDESGQAPAGPNRRLALALVALCAVSLCLGRASASGTGWPLDREAEKWVAGTLKKMTLAEKVGQLLVPSLFSTFVSTDSEAFDALARLVREYHVGGLHVFGGREPAPSVLLNPTYGSVTLGQPLAAASLLNRLQRLAKIPLLNTADFEAGVGFRLAGATVFPRAMAFGAASDERLVYESARITGVEARAIGVHVNFAPVADVNNNPRNPVINTRSFGEGQVRAVGETVPSVASFVAAYVRGAWDGGIIATLKHFPGHGDTDVDSHLGLPIIRHPRERLDQVELPPFRAGIEAGAGAVMTAHIGLPALDPDPSSPTTFSGTIVSALLRGEMGFQGLVYTDSMSMNAVAQMFGPGEAAVRAIKAGHDVVLHSPDDVAAFEGIKGAVERGEIAESRIDASVERILRAKARLGLHKSRTVDLEAVAVAVGGRAHAAVAEAASERSITLVKDERDLVPLRLAREAAVLYLSILDYPSGWRIAAPSRTFLPELQQRWPNVTAIELSDRTSPAELELVRASAGRYDAIVASVFVRTAAYSGRMDLAAPVVRLLQDVARRPVPFVTVFFGNPYAATFLPELPAMILTYDFYDLAERSAVRALAGEIPVTGRLPITLPGLFSAGHGLERPAPER